MNEYEKQTIVLKNGDTRSILVPVNPGKLSRTPDGTRFDMIEKRIRNPALHKLSFKLATYLKGYLPHGSPMIGESEYTIIKGLTAAAGYYTTVSLSEKDHFVIPDSIAFDKMGQEKHNEIMEKLYDKCEEYTGHYDLRENLDMYLAGFS